jgi:hypothetical protein
MLHCITHWPFCPGVFIAILGFVAVYVTFRLGRETTKAEKRLWIALCFLLMWGEIWMMSKDRDAHDGAEKQAREESQKMARNVALLTLLGTSTENHWVEIQGKLQSATDPRLIAALQGEAKTAKKQYDDASLTLLLTMAPGIISELTSWTIKWTDKDNDIEKASSPSKPNPTPEEVDKLKRAVYSQRLQLNTEYTREIMPLLMSTKYLRDELLRRLPNHQETERERNVDAIFAKVLAGQPMNYVDMSNVYGDVKNLIEKFHSTQAP